VVLEQLDKLGHRDLKALLVQLDHKVVQGRQEKQVPLVSQGLWELRVEQVLLEIQALQVLLVFQEKQGQQGDLVIRDLQVALDQMGQQDNQDPVGLQVVLVPQDLMVNLV